MKRVHITLTAAVLVTTLNLSAASVVRAGAVRQAPPEAVTTPAISAAVTAPVPTAVPDRAVTGQFLLLDVDGRVCVYEGDTLIMTTAIDVASLPASDRAALSVGIHAGNSAELASLLEDFGA